MALYTDRAHWAFHTPKAKGPVDKTRLTQVGRALARLGIEHIPVVFPAGARPERAAQSHVPGSPRQRAAGRGDHDARGGQSVSRAISFVPAAQRDVRARRRAIPRVPSCRSARVDLDADSLSRRGARRRTRQHRDDRRARVCRSPRSRAGAAVSGLTRHRPPAPRRAAYTITRGTPTAAAPFRRRRAAHGRCRSRGRQERAHRCLENAQNAFPTAPTGVTLGKAVRSLVKRKRTHSQQHSLADYGFFFLTGRRSATHGRGSARIFRSDAGRTPARGRRGIARNRRITSTMWIVGVLVIRGFLAIPPRDARCAQLRFRRASSFSLYVSVRPVPPR